MYGSAKNYRGYGSAQEKQGITKKTFLHLFLYVTSFLYYTLKLLGDNIVNEERDVGIGLICSVYMPCLPCTLPS